MAALEHWFEWQQERASARYEGVSNPIHDKQ